MLTRTGKLVRAWPYVLACAGGLGVAYINLRTDEVTLVAVPLFTVAFVLGLARSRRAWRWALLAAVWTPIGQACALAVGMRLTYPNDAGALASAALGVLLFALLGAYSGVVAGRVVARGDDREAKKPS